MFITIPPSIKWTSKESYEGCQKELQEDYKRFSANPNLETFVTLQANSSWSSISRTIWPQTSISLRFSKAESLAKSPKQTRENIPEGKEEKRKKGSYNVFITNFAKGPNWQFGTIINSCGPRSYII